MKKKEKENDRKWSFKKDLKEEIESSLFLKKSDGEG